MNHPSFECEQRYQHLRSPRAGQKISTWSHEMFFRFAIRQKEREIEREELPIKKAEQVMLPSSTRLKLVTRSNQASTQLQAWRGTEKGQQAWHTTLPSLEQICNALDNTQTATYGLLIAPQFFTILSTYNRQSFQRLSSRYEAAAQAGLCFWWNGTRLCHCEQIDHFFVLLQALPAPRRLP